MKNGKGTLSKDVIKRLVAYLNNEPIGVVDVIESENYIELDGFGVLEPISTPRNRFYHAVISR